MVIELRSISLVDGQNKSYTQVLSGEKLLGGKSSEIYYMMKSGYRSQSKDTHIDSDRYQFKLLRQRSPWQRLLMAAKLMRGERLNQ